MLSGQSAEALSDLNQSLKLNPNQARAYNNIGNVYKNDNLLQEAIANYRKALTIDPKYINAYFNLARIHLDTNLKEAEKYINQALSIDPEHPDAHMLLSMLYYKKAEHETNPDRKAQYKKDCEKEQHIGRRLRVKRRR